jgi:hypothetical protein
LGSWIGDTGGTDNPSEEDPATCRVEVGEQDEGLEKVTPMEKQATGSLSGWWTGAYTKPEEGSAEAFLESLKVTYVLRIRFPSILM